MNKYVCSLKVSTGAGEMVQCSRPMSEQDVSKQHEYVEGETSCFSNFIIVEFILSDNYKDSLFGTFNI